MKYTTFCLICCVCTFFASSVGAVEFDEVSERIQIHGFLSQGYLSSDSNNYFAGTQNGTFQFNEFGLNFSTDLSDRLRAGIQLFSRDLGDEGNNDLEVDWMYGDYRWKDWLGFRAGKIKSPFGLYNESRDVDMLRTWIFLPHLYNETWRDVYLALQGVGVYGYLASDIGNFNYQMLVGEMNLTETGSIANMLEHNSGMPIQHFEGSLAVNGGLDWLTPLDGLRLGVSLLALDMEVEFENTAESHWLTQDLPLGTTIPYRMENTRMYVLSAEYLCERFMLAGEYLWFMTDSTVFHIPEDWDGQESYYVSIAYRLTDWWEIGAYYSVFYPDAHDKTGKELQQVGKEAHRNWQKEFVFTTRFDVNEQWALKLEGHLIDGSGILQQYNPPDQLERNSFLFAIKTTFSF